MANRILQDASKLLVALFKESEKSQEQPEPWFVGKQLSECTGLNAKEINDAVDYLHDRGFLERLDFSGTYPFVFGQIQLNSRGRYAYHDMVSQTSEQIEKGAPSSSDAIIGATPPFPVGSPFGFTDLDWEFVQTKKRQLTNLFVVMGFQFGSPHYNTEKLKANIEQTFLNAVNKYNERGGRENIILEFKPLAAGYGEHLFNQIARDIIAADVAVFETSDLNANVMIEMGVALTWGSRVLPIKQHGCAKPPSDISGQTWADYTEDGSTFVNHNHNEEMLAMVERAIQKKSH